MRINKVPSSKLINQYIHVRESAKPTPRSQGADKVELTNESQTFSMAFKAAKDAIANRPQQDADRAAQIKQQLQDNAYSISGYEIAKKILGE